jgi:biotin carboxyl carrier protein
MALMSGARFGVLLRKTAAEPDTWRRVVAWPATRTPDSSAREFVRDLENIANSCAQQETVIRFFNGAPDPLAADCAVAVQLESDSPQETWVTAFFLPECSESQAAWALGYLRLVRNTPGLYRLHRSMHQSQLKLSHFASVMDLMALLNAQSRFMAVAMTLCNELAARHKCDRVSLGWLEHEYVRLQAISHTERFEKKMDAVKTLEQTMEESLDQDELIVWPPPEADTRISTDHARYADGQTVKFLCSVPLRLAGQAVGIITCERNSEAFPEEEQRLLTLCAEMAVRRLSELKRSDRWWGARAALEVREQLAKAVGVEHTWAKVVAVLVAVGLAVLFFGKMNYRVEAPFILRTDDLAILSAPFEGYIDEVPAQIGDPVQPDDVLLKLDTRDLLLQEAAAAADLDRYTREADKARATSALAEMRIAQAQAEQSRVRLELIRYRLSQASLKARFAGVVVEGDLKKRIGAPVKQGDALFKVARTDRMYVECNVKENDIHEVRGEAAGEFAFASQPKLRFPMQLERIEPVAQVKDKDNIFVVRCQFKGAPENWWRPGMSGVAKINVGQRTFFWIIAHRTIDFLRMYFWW